MALESALEWQARRMQEARARVAAEASLVAVFEEPLRMVAAEDREARRAEGRLRYRRRTGGEGCGYYEHRRVREERLTAGRADCCGAPLTEVSGSRRWVLRHYREGTVPCRPSKDCGNEYYRADRAARREGG